MKSNRFTFRSLFIAIFILCFSFVPSAYAAEPHNNQVVIMTVQELRDAGVPLPDGTFIKNGEALSSDDLIMFNSHIAVAISVGTPNPWGYPPNSILDASLMVDSRSGSESLLDAAKNGSLKAGTDTIWDMEFLMDNWDSWGPENSKPRTMMISENIDFDGDGVGDGNKGLVSTRKFAQEGKTPMDVVTYYVLGNDDNYLRINTIVSNPANGDAYDKSVSTDGPGLSTGYSLGNKGAYMFAPDKSVGAPYNKFVNTYNKEYSVSLIDLKAETADLWGSSGYKDTERKTSYEPGKTYNFEAIFRIDNQGSLEGTLNQLMNEVKVETVAVSGKVLDSATSTPVKSPIIVVEKGEKTFTWVIGKENGSFGFDLPKVEDMNTYKVYALKELYSPSEKAGLTLTGKAYDAGSLKLASTEQITVTVKNDAGQPINARVELLGVTTPAVRYVAQTVFFTDLDNIGLANIPVAAGPYNLEVSSGGYFESLPIKIQGNSATEKATEVTIKKLIAPTANWYSADLHHHTNKSDGSTLPINLIKSQLANGLDVIVTSDHDSIASNGEVADYASKRNVTYLPSLEVSPSWAHFGIFPVTPTAATNMITNKFSIDPYMDFPAMVKKAHNSGTIIVANHPYIAYGLFTAQAASAVPGGYDSNFDLIEINGGVKAAKNQQALDKAMDFWTASLTGSKRYYLTGGSDTHDVLTPNMKTSLYSGKTRTYVNIPGELTSASYMDALLKGNSYVTMGPILYSNNLFGQSTSINNGDKFNLSFDAMSVKGISKVEIFTSGKKIAMSKEFATPSMNRESLSFSFEPNASTWYNIIVTDADGNKAISNPMWVEVKAAPAAEVKGAPATEVKSGARYIVKQGDTVYHIAIRYGTTMQAIILANNLHNPDLIYPGQSFIIPGVSEFTK